MYIMKRVTGKGHELEIYNLLFWAEIGTKDFLDYNQEHNSMDQEEKDTGYFQSYR